MRQSAPDSQKPGCPVVEPTIHLQRQVAELKARLANYEFKLEQRQSGVEGAGTGLYTKTFIPAGRVVGEYTGTPSWRLLVPATGRYVVWQKDSNNRPYFLDQDTYILWLVDEGEDEDEHPQRGYYPEVHTGIDGSASSNLMRYANSDDHPNLEMFVTENHHVIALSVRDIEPGEELFWDYHPGRDKDFDSKPDHMETDLKRFIRIGKDGDVRLTEQALETPPKPGGKSRKKKRKRR